MAAARALLASLLAIAIPGIASAQNLGLIVRDGSLGEPGLPLEVPPGLDPSGAEAQYLITREMGELVGGRNLFHSFDRFGIGTGETATFTGPASVENVVSRVTGGAASEVDGTLRSTMPAADIYLLNPAGLVFGPGARLDVPAGFHASTADRLELEGGELFEAHGEGAVPLLAVADPVAFGFLSEAPVGISLEGSQLAVPAGETFRLVAGDLETSGGRLAAGRGRIELVGVGSPGRVVLPGDPADPPRLEGFTELADVTLARSEVTTRTTAGGGRIFLRGGDIQLDHALVSSDVGGDTGAAGSVDIEATGRLRVGDTRVAAFSTGATAGGPAASTFAPARSASTARTGTARASTSGASRGVRPARSASRPDASRSRTPMPRRPSTPRCTARGGGPGRWWSARTRWCCATAARS
jgi:filamentous hemagglutinin family protein